MYVVYLYRDAMHPVCSVARLQKADERGQPTPVVKVHAGALGGVLLWRKVLAHSDSRLHRRTRWCLGLHTHAKKAFAIGLG